MTELCGYRPGYIFKVASTQTVGEDGKVKKCPAMLYDKPWDHALAPDQQGRNIVTVLEDGTEVTVLEYRNGAVRAKESWQGLEGWLG